MMREVGRTLLLLYWSVVFMTSVVGNCCLLTSVVTQTTMRTPANMYIANIAISDLLLTLSSVAEIVEFLEGGWTFGDVFCRIHGSLIEVIIFYKILL